MSAADLQNDTLQIYNQQHHLQSELLQQPHYMAQIGVDSSPSTKTTPIPHLDDYFDNFMWIYFSPVLLLFGLTGNVITLVVMQRKAFRSTSTGIYMSLLAIMDSSFLLVGLFLEWLEWCNFVTFKYLHVWTCKIHRFLFYGSGDAAIWLIVAFSFDRFVAICFPLHKSQVCVRSRAMIAFYVILAADVIKNGHVFWSRGRDDDRLCTAIEPFVYFEVFVRPWLALALSMALPFCLILLFNCLMVHTLMKAQRRRTATQTMAGRESSGSLSSSGTMGCSGGSKTYMQTTLMCLSVSFAFLLCVAPSIVFLVGKPYWDQPENLWYDYAKVISNLLVYVNHSVNFILYCVTGQRFRSELAAMFKRNRTKPTPVKRSISNTSNVSGAPSQPGYGRSTSCTESAGSATPRYDKGADKVAKRSESVMEYSRLGSFLDDPTLRQTDV